MLQSNKVMKLRYFLHYDNNIFFAMSYNIFQTRFKTLSHLFIHLIAQDIR